MGRSSDGIFVDPDRRGEVARHEIVAGVIGTAREHDAPRRHACQLAKVGIGRADDRGVLDDHQLIQGGASHVLRRDAQRFQQARRRIAGLRRHGRKVHLDEGVARRAGQQAALGMKADRLRDGMHAFRPEGMRRGQRGVSAERDFDLRREPAERVAVVALSHEGRLCQIHLSGDSLHPLAPASCSNRAHGRRIPGKRPVRERIDLPALHAGHG